MNAKNLHLAEYPKTGSNSALVQPTVSASLTGSCLYLVKKGGLWEKRGCPGGQGEGDGNMPFSEPPSHPTLPSQLPLL